MTTAFSLKDSKNNNANTIGKVDTNILAKNRSAQITNKIVIKTKQATIFEISVAEIQGSSRASLPNSVSTARELTTEQDKGNGWEINKYRIAGRESL